MAHTARVPLSVDLGDLFHDLESVETGLGKLLKGSLKEAGNTAASRLAELLPRGPGPQGGKDNLPHIADTLAGSATQTYAQVVSDHPGAGVLTWGGTIAPRGVEIVFPAKEYALRAADDVLPVISEQLQADIDRLASTYLDS